MKKVILIFVILFCFTSQIVAEESQNLSQQAMESVQQQTREMSELGISEVQARKMLTQMVQNNFQKQNQILARKVVMDTAREGLPTEPVISKALEGMAKRAKEQNIIAAMKTVQNRYAYANQVAKSLSADEKNIKTLTQAIADSLTAGMKTQNLEVVTSRLQARKQAKDAIKDDALAIQTMQTARDMVRQNIRSSDVAATLCRALQNKYTIQEIKQLRNQTPSQYGRSSSTGGRGLSSSGGRGSSSSGSRGSGSSGGRSGGGGGKR